MPAAYRTLAEFAQTWGLAYFVTVFVLVVAYALWPSRKERFEQNSRIPLRED